MNDDRRHQKVREFAKKVAFDILDSRFFRELVKETVLRVLVAQEQLRSVGTVQAFLNECDDKQIRVRLKDDGKLYFTNADRIDAGLKAVLTLYRADIIKHLDYQRRLEINLGKQDKQKPQAEKK